MHPTLDPVIAEYLELSLTIERLFPGFVDGYFGPPQLREAVETAPEPQAAELLRRAEALNVAVEAADLDPRRTDFFSAQTRAMVAICRKLTGDELPYREEVETFFDIAPDATPEAMRRSPGSMPCCPARARSGRAWSNGRSGPSSPRRWRGS